MIPLMFVRVVWSAHKVEAPRPPGPAWRDLVVSPEPAHPFGRKGLALAAAWSSASPDTAGMVIIDGDTMIDPVDYLEMIRAVNSDPAAVWTAPVRIWPASTDRASWVWAHWKGEPSQENEPNPVSFSFNFTYLPSSLMHFAIKNGLRNWRYPGVDKNMSRVARTALIPVRVIPGCWPKHLHF